MHFALKWQQAKLLYWEGLPGAVGQTSLPLCFHQFLLFNSSCIWVGSWVDQAVQTEADLWTSRTTVFYFNRIHGSIQQPSLLSLDGCSGWCMTWVCEGWVGGFPFWLHGTAFLPDF
uniref:Uncharacterized protein n=1 Tax=Sphaerodactylus townsendi TaxID=933632 RepID=A0ACB8EDF1_9SAUR